MDLMNSDIVKLLMGQLSGQIGSTGPASAGNPVADPAAFGQLLAQSPEMAIPEFVRMGKSPADINPTALVGGGGAPAPAATGMPMDITSPAQKTALVGGATAPANEVQASEQNRLGSLAKSLAGVKAPPSPEMPKVSTPAPYRHGNISGAVNNAQIQALLQAMMGSRGNNVQRSPLLGVK